MIRFATLPAAALLLLLSGCRDARREAVHDYLQNHPPEGFEVAAIPADIFITKAADGASETAVAVRYRLTQPTVEIRDLFSLPRGSDLAKRIAGVRGWALSSLPTGDPAREAISSASAAARAAFPIKQLVTPKGTEIDATVILSLSKEPGGWKVAPQSSAVSVPGSPDRNPQIPFEDSPEVAAKFDELEAIARQLEGSRRKCLADRQRAAERSRAKLRSLLTTGSTFEGHLPDRTPIRVVISRGADAGDAIVVVVSVEGASHSSARYAGALAQQPSGEALWRAAQVTSLSGPGGQRLTDEISHPILTLMAAGNGLTGEAKTGSESPISFGLNLSGKVDLIPDSLLQGAAGN